MYVTSTRTYTASTTLMVNLEGEAAAAQTADIVASLTGSTKNAIAPAFAFATSAKLLENVSIKEGLVDDGEFNNKLREPTMRARIFEALRPAIDQFKNLVGAEPPAIAEKPDWAAPAVLDERRAVRALKRRVIVTDLKDELQLRISVTTEEPEKSARLANTMATMLNASMLDTKTDALDNARDWIKEEAERVEGSIREIEDEINEEIVAGNAIAATETLGSNTERLLESELLLEANALRTEALLRLSDVIDLMQDNVDAHTAFATLPEGLRNELLIDYAPIFLWERRDGPPTRAELLTAERQIERDQENQVAATNRLLQEVLPVQAYTRKLSTAQNRFRQLQAKYVAGQELLGKLRESEAELQIQREGEVRRLTVMETAKPPLTHTSPALLPLLVIGAFAGLLLGIAIMLIKFFRRDAFTSLEDVEQTFGAPTVAVISDFRKGLRKKFAWKMLSTEIAEAYRRAYSAIFVVRSEENPHALMVTSSIPSEGKTTTSIYIAAAAAEEGRSTLLIDLDFRKRSVTRYLEVEHEFGVYSVFRGERSVKDAVMAYEPGNFDILTTDGRTRTGTIGEDGEELSRETLSAVKVQQLIKDAKDHYDVVVVDVPPILAVQDANMIGRMVDSTIFVVATQTLKKKAAKRAMTEWKRGEQDLFGLIVRGEKSELHEYYGYDYYHYNYATKEDDRPRRTTSRRRKRRTSTDAKKASGQRD
jgi:capsular exopolysaccharide synthesis family protein